MSEHTDPRADPTEGKAEQGQPEQGQPEQSQPEESQGEQATREETSGKATASKATAKRATAKKTTASKATAKRATAKKATASKATASKATAKEGAETPREAEEAERGARSVPGLLVDGAYAVVGVGDQAVTTLRELPARAASLREEPQRLPRLAQERAKEALTELRAAPRDLQARLEEGIRSRASAWRGEAVEGLASLAQRGRGVVGDLGSTPAARRALDQTKVAQSQVKAATTSVRRAAGESLEAFESAQSQVKAATTSVRKAATESLEALEAAAEQVTGARESAEQSASGTGDAGAGTSGGGQA